MIQLLALLFVSLPVLWNHILHTRHHYAYLKNVPGKILGDLDKDSLKTSLMKVVARITFMRQAKKSRIEYETYLDARRVFLGADAINLGGVQS